MTITGEMLIGDTAVYGNHGTVRAFSPAAGTVLEPEFGGGTKADVDRACSLAAEAFDAYRETSLSQRASFLRGIGKGILALGETLIDRAMAESGLPRPRLEGERGRTIGQLDLFASIVESGRFLNATIDPALPDRKPLPRPDLRLRRIALGPVAVFGASNFPLAFSVAGGDTAAALAAGCPVVVKAHPAHLGTSELVGRVIQQAVRDSGLPPGVFSLLVGIDNEVGQALVRHPAIQAVGFTGSRSGGLSLMQAAAARPQPIPVFAEMSSINPVLVFPAALAHKAELLAKGFVDSLVLGVGQFCTNPGLVIGVESEAFTHFREVARQEIATRAGGVMLSPGIHAAYQKGVSRLENHASVETLASMAENNSACHGMPALFAVSGAQLLAYPELSEEVFGPSSLLVTCKTPQEMLAVLSGLEGQLTATILAEDDDAELIRPLLPVLERKVGRIVYNGYPTGVEVAYAMVHGGPFPATSDGRSTSVGAGAIDRFLRAVSYQNLPQSLLPEPLRDGNPLHIPLTVDTKLV